MLPYKYLRGHLWYVSMSDTFSVVGFIASIKLELGCDEATTSVSSAALMGISAPSCQRKRVTRSSGKPAINASRYTDGLASFLLYPQRLLLPIITTSKLQEPCIIGHKCSGIPSGCQVLGQKCSGTPRGCQATGCSGIPCGCQVMLFLFTLPQEITHDGCLDE